MSGFSVKAPAKGLVAAFVKKAAKHPGETPRKRGREPLHIGELVTNIGLLCVGAWITWEVFFAGFAFPFAAEIMPWVTVCTLTFSALVWAGHWLKGWTRLLAALLGLIWLWVGWQTWEQLWMAPEIFARFITPNLNRIVSYEFAIPPYTNHLEAERCRYFCAYLLVPYLGLLSEALLVMKSRTVVLLMTVPIFAFTYALQGLPDRPLVLVSFLFWLVVLLKPKVQSRQFPASHVISVGGGLLSAVFLAILLWGFPESDFEPHPRTAEIRDGLVETSMRIEEYGLFQGLGLGGGAPLTGSDASVDLNSMGTIRFTDTNVLKVFSGQKQTLYLRGYSAARYDGNQWSQEPEGMLEGPGFLTDSMRFLSEVGSRDYSYSGIDFILPENRAEALFRIGVEPLTGESNYSFTPYLLESMDPSVDFFNDAYYPGTGEKSTVFTSYGSGNLGIFEEQVAVCAEQVDGFLKGGVDFDPLLQLRRGLYYGKDTGDRTDAFQGAVSSEGYLWLGSNEEFGMQGHMISDLHLAEYLEAVGDGVEYDIYAGDKNYIQGIRKVYTQLPAGLSETLLDWWLARQGLDLTGTAEELLAQHRQALSATPEWQWGMVAAEVADTVRDSGFYTKNPGRQPMNRDFVEYFLNERNRGYCVHYASATVTLLRAMGIPARYVEGYVVEGGAFDEQGTALVPAENAHAWGEIWLPNIGWVPVESTPGGAAPASTLPQPMGQEAPSASAEPSPSPTPISEESTPPQEEALTPHTDNQTPPPLQETDPEKESGRGRLAGALGFAGLGGLLWGLRFLGIRRRQKRYRDKDINRSILYLYGQQKRLSRFGGALSQTGTDLAMKAQFCGHPLTEEERSSMIALLKGSIAKIETTGKWNRFFLRLLGLLKTPM